MRKILIFILSFSIFYLLFITPVQAACNCKCYTDPAGTILAADMGAVPTGSNCGIKCSVYGSYKCGSAGDTTGSGKSSGGTVELKPVITGTPQEIIGKIIKQALGIVGSLALVMFIWGGIVWMTSAGSSEKVTKGKNIIIWAAIGLVVIFSSYALVKFVIQTTAGK